MTFIFGFLVFYFGGMFATMGVITSAQKLKASQPQLRDTMEDLEEDETLYGIFSIVFWPVFSFGGLFIDD